jgi:spoIIIJ-associated protein
MSSVGSDPLEVAAERLEGLLEKVVSALALDAQVRVEEADGALVGRVAGDDLGRFIGRRGQTINAIQHLAQRLVLRDMDETLRVVVDAGDYRDRRAETLRAIADDAAEEALRTGRAVELEPLPPLERRLIHEHLRELGGVETHSEGQDPDRYLVVSPAAG